MALGTRRAFMTALASALGSCGVASRQDDHAQILLFNGAGVSPGSAAAIATILRNCALRFASAGSRALNEMNEPRLRAHKLLIIPGGNFELLGNALSPSAAARIRRSVLGGLNYLGICAGAFFAGASPYNGANLTDGVRFNFYSLEASGVRKAAVPIATPDGATLEHYWEDGPELSGWGETIARYPDGTPAAVQGPVGRGWVILAGVHPEAGENWRRGMTFSTPARIDNAFAAKLIFAALNRRRLAHF